MRILCAVRGGLESERTIEYAVSLAEKENAFLVFLYVISLDFFVPSSSVRAKTMIKEFSRMGEFVLLMAQAKAATEGVSADTCVREGNITKEILTACQEMRVEVLILGKAQEGNEDSFFGIKTQNAFVEKMKSDFGIRVILV